MTSESLIWFFIGLVVVLIALVAFANVGKNTTNQKLLKYLQPYELFFTTVKRQTFANGIIQRTWVAFNVIQRSKNYILIKMRTRIDLPSAPKFILCTEKTRRYVASHEHAEHVKQWTKADDQFYFFTQEAEFPKDQLLEAITPEIRAQVAQLESDYEGMLIYSIDAELFGQQDKNLQEALPELQHEIMLFTHVVISDKLNQDAFNQFVERSIQLANTLEKSLSFLVPPLDESTKATRRLKLKRFSGQA